jgi:hypothetical protein
LAERLQRCHRSAKARFSIYGLACWLFASASFLPPSRSYLLDPII